MNGEQKEDRLTLEVLSAVDSGPELSQRRLASQMGVALGLTNSYMKRCVRKGFVKIAEAPANRYLYYLTPRGFREKSRLTARFLASSLDFYRMAAESCGRMYHACSIDGVDAVLLCGRSDLAEIALLKSMETSIEVKGLYDEVCEHSKFFSRSVWHDLDEAPEIPRVLTRIEDADGMLARLRKHAPDISIYVPDILGLRPAG